MLQRPGKKGDAQREVDRTFEHTAYIFLRMATTPSFDVFGLLGKALGSSAVKNFLSATGTAAPKPAKDDDDDVLCVENESRGLAMELVRASDYSAEYAVPAATRRDLDWVVACVDLLGKGTNTRKTRAWPDALPFGLVFGDPSETVVAKVAHRPASREVGTGYAHAWWFRFGNFKLLAALDGRKRLLWLRVVPLDADTARAIARKSRRASRQRGSR